MIRKDYGIMDLKRKTKKRAGRRRGRAGKNVILHAAGGVFILLAGGCLFVLQSYTKVDLSEEAAVAFSGFDTKGSISVLFEPQEEYKEFYETVETTVTPDKNLSNGDEVTLQFAYDEALAKELHLRVEAEETKIAVSGLAQAQEVTLDELFSNLKITYEGIAPQLMVHMENISDDAFFKRVSFLVENPQEFYDAGDTLTVRAAFDEEEAIRLNYDIAAGANGYEKEFTIEGVDSYLRSTEDLGEEEIRELSDAGKSLLHDANNYGLRIFSEANLMPIWVNNETTFVWSNPRLLSMYFHVVKEENEGKIGTHENDLECVYMATISQADGVSCQAEVVVRFTELLKKADGSIDLSIETGEIISASYQNSNIKQLITNDDDYVTEKLNLPG